MTTQRVTYLTAPRTIVLAEEPRPAPGPGEALVRLTAVGVCGSDVHWFTEGHIGETAIGEPLTLGHEPAGRVIAVGAGVDPALAGRRVAIEPAIHCGVCEFCEEGHTNLCPNVRFLGTPAAQGAPTQGALRELLVHPAHLLTPLPDSVSDEVGALLEPLGIAVHTINLLRPRLASTFVIQGAGPIGLCALLAARLCAPERLIVIEPRQNRRALALELGADLALSPEDPDVAGEVQNATGGRGAHYVIEAVGAAASFRQMVDFARPAAKLAVVGIAAGDDFGFANSPARRKGLTLLMVRRSRHTLARAIALTARGHWHPEALITHRLGLGQVGHALEMLADYADGVVKVMIDPRR